VHLPAHLRYMHIRMNRPINGRQLPFLFVQNFSSVRAPQTLASCSFRGENPPQCGEEQ
jgi:hypothetical protein